MKKLSNINEGDWYRTCQECGYEQRAHKPIYNKDLTKSYVESKCRRCRSMALDYGKTMRADDNEAF